MLHVAQAAPVLMLLRGRGRRLEAQRNIDQDAQEDEPANQHDRLPGPVLGVLLDNHNTSTQGLTTMGSEG